MSKSTLVVKNNDLSQSEYSDVAKPLRFFERLYDVSVVRKLIIFGALIMAWQLYAERLDNPLLFPTFSATAEAFVQGVISGQLVERSLSSLGILVVGYAIGVVLALILTGFATVTRIGNDLLETLTAMFNPLPAIALLPLALLWFGLGDNSLVFVLVHSVLWPVALCTNSGFKSVSTTLKMVGKNYGLKGIRFVWLILLPAAFPSILSGLKNGWAFAWRTLIAAELVFGVSAGSGGLGWFIYENKNQLEIPTVFSGLLTVILIGLAVENLIFKTIETHTLHKWGMHSK